MRGVASLRPAQGRSSFEKLTFERLNPGPGGPNKYLRGHPDTSLDCRLRISYVIANVQLFFNLLTCQKYGLKLSLTTEYSVILP
jgi:hypothetical protein